MHRCCLADVFYVGDTCQVRLKFEVASLQRLEVRGVACGHYAFLWQHLQSLALEMRSDRIHIHQ